jgi:hypothetical protein
VDGREGVQLSCVNLFQMLYWHALVHNVAEHHGAQVQYIV